MELRPDEVDDLFRRRPSAIHFHARPAHDIQFNAFERGHFAIFHCDDDSALRPGLPDRAALHVAGEHHVGIVADDFELMDVAECPILIAARAEVIEAAGRVVFVALPAGECGVQHPDVEGVLVGRRLSTSGRSASASWRRSSPI